MHIVERFTRVGDAINYDVTLEDPEVLGGTAGVPDAVIRKQAVPRASSRNVATARRRLKPKRLLHR
jgi:hypothetical protein